MSRTEQPTLWTVDVEALKRTVTVAVTHAGSPSVADLLNALDGDEREAARRAFAAAYAGESRSSGDSFRRPSHVCVDMCAGLGCCPGCGDGCSHCIAYVVCITREIGCVMPQEHRGPCVPSAEPRWALITQITDRAELYRRAGIAYTITANERNPGRFCLDIVHDRQVPSSGRWRRRLTSHNRAEFIVWLGDRHLAGADETSAVGFRDDSGEANVIRPGDIVDQAGDRWSILRAQE